MIERWRLRLWGGWLLGLGLGSLSFLTLCDLSFDCGCCAPGLGGLDHCDIQIAGPPDCPWCEHLVISAFVFVWAAVSALLVTWVAVARLPFVVVVAASWAGFNLATIVAGIATAIALGRPVLAGL